MGWDCKISNIVRFREKVKRNARSLEKKRRGKSYFRDLAQGEIAGFIDQSLRAKDFWNWSSKSLKRWRRGREEKAIKAQRSGILRKVEAWADAQRCLTKEEAHSGSWNELWGRVLGKIKKGARTGKSRLGE